MKVLILTLTVGQGHNSTSFALAQYLKTRGADCIVLDTYKYLNKLVGDSLDKGYASIAKHLPELNLLIYDKAEKDSVDSMQRKTYFPYAFAELSKKKMKKYIDSEEPDVIVCTHIFTAILITQMKQDGIFTKKIPDFGIVTDFTLPPFWEETVLDYYIMANELLIYAAEKRGIERNRILPFGIPVKESFSIHMEPSVARSQLKLKDKMTILIIGSTVGFGNIPMILSNLDKTPLDFQVVLICGRNNRLFAKVADAIYKKDVIVTGYVDNVELYMDAADCIVTKPGGLTVSEVLAKRKPLIITDPLPGVENRNVIFLLNNNLAVYAGKYTQIDEIFMQLISQPERLNQMKRAQELYGRRHSAKAMGDFILNIDI